jgi:hypothetical protein
MGGCRGMWIYALWRGSTSMHDGNKEATKELLATFRAICATAVSVILLATNFQIRGQLVVKNDISYVVSIGSLALSVALCFVLFLMAIPKLFNEENGIPYQPSLVVIGCLSIGSFVVGAVLLVLAQI